MRKGHRFALFLLALCVVVGALCGAVMLVVGRQKPANAQERLYALLRDEGLIRGSGWPVAIYVRGVSGKTLLNPVLKWCDHDGDVTTIWIAREGELQVDDSSGTMVVCVRCGYGMDRDGCRVDFVERHLEFDLPPGFCRNE
jgi:hypothetical protein